jgi:predicted O-methyltransferase YrrM
LSSYDLIYRDENESGEEMGKAAPQDLWIDVDRYISDHLAGQDAALIAALDANTSAGLPPIDVSANMGKFLHLLAQLRGARRILEVGTLGGYSTIWLARALPADGRLITLEVSPHHAEVASANMARAGVAQLVEIRVGPALESLAQLEREDAEPFDFIFIDADKPNNPAYFGWALKLSRSGTVIVVDNVVRDGEIVDAGSTDPAIQGTRRLFEMLAAETRVSATALQVVGGKGYDGFAMVLVK